MVNTYTVLKTIHVIAAVTWVGGGTILTTLIARARRASDYGKLATLIKELEFVGPRIFATSGGIRLSRRSSTRCSRRGARPTRRRWP